MNRKEKALEFASDVFNYNFQITGRHMDVTDSLKNYAIEKLSKIDKFTNRIIDANIIFDIQKIQHHVEISLKIGNLQITAKANTDDMYASIDKAVNKLEAQILRYKSKMNDRHKPSALKVNVMAPLALVEDLEDDLEEYPVKEPVDEFKPHQIVKQDTMPLKMLTLNEAALKMEFSNDSFMIFKCESDQKLKVIYRRDDGNYGIIEPSC